MDPFKSNNTSNNSQKSASTNPFARALAESEKRSLSKGSNLPTGNMADKLSGLNHDNLNLNNPNNSLFNSEQYQRQQEQAQEELKKKQMREKLHRMINPVEQTDIYSAQEEKRKKEINEVRKELKALAEEIAKFYSEVDIALTQDVVSPGQSGTYHQNFFEKLKEFIRMLRQRVSSARTWARQAKMKKKKKYKGKGLDFANQEAKSTHDMLHHERSNAFGA